MQKAPTIKDWLIESSKQLAEVGIPSAKLDAEIILSSVIEKDRTFLHAHSDEIIESKKFKLAHNILKKRLKRLPIAYITGKKEFYGRIFKVTKNTLIPRPESEDIINLLKSIVTNKQSDLQLIDVGTGSGCLGISAKLEFPRFSVTLADVSIKALDVAKNNAINLSADVETLQSNLLQKYTHNPDIILANLPYVDVNWERSPETNFEPKLALFANKKGLFLIEKLIDQSKQKLQKDGLIFIESDPIQHANIAQYAKDNSFELIDKLNYILVFKKI